MEAKIIVANNGESPQEFIKRARKEVADFAIAKRNEIVTVIYCISTKAIIFGQRNQPSHIKKLQSDIYIHTYLKVKNIQSTQAWLEETFKDFVV